MVTKQQTTKTPSVTWQAVKAALVRGGCAAAKPAYGAYKDAPTYDGFKVWARADYRGTARVFVDHIGAYVHHWHELSKDQRAARAEARREALLRYAAALAAAGYAVQMHADGQRAEAIVATAN